MIFFCKPVKPTSISETYNESYSDLYSVKLKKKKV